MCSVNCAGRASATALPAPTSDAATPAMSSGVRRTVDIGRDAEQAAAEFLRARGLRPVDRNFRCRGGEVDLIMRHGEHLVFVEVRYRRSERFGSAAESVVAAKRRRLLHAAEYYVLREHRTGAPPPVRFDVVAVRPQEGGLRLEWIVDAFRADEGWRR